MSFTSVFIITYIFFSIVLLASNLQRVYTVKKKNERIIIKKIQS